MAACPRCGYGNDSGADFCGNPDCRADLRAGGVGRPPGPRPPVPGPGPDGPSRYGPAPTGPRGPGGATGPYRPVPPGAPVRVGWLTPPGPPPGDGAPPTSAPPSDGQRRGVRLSMADTELRVEPGGTVSTTVTVRNRGTRVEQFRLGVNGPAAPLAQVHPPALSVFPDDEQTAEVRFTAPRAPWPPAGRAPFQVVVGSDVHADVRDRAVGGLTVGRFDQLGATLEPEMTRGRSAGRHRVQLVNHGNAPLMVSVALADRDGELTYDPPRFTVPVGQGATEVGEVSVGAAVRWFGRVQSLPFTATVTAAGVPQPVLLNGVRRQVPRFPWWIPTAALAVAGLLIALYAILPGARIPSVGTDRVAAVAALKDAGYDVGEIEKPDEDVTAGLVIGTQPPAGTEFAKGERVQLFVSAGPCRGPCPVKVPVVDGLLVADAQQDLTAAQFVVDRITQVENTLAAGMVISTNPAGGSEAAIGSAIVLTVSSGPPGGATSAPATPGGDPAAPGGGGAAPVLPDVAGVPVAAAEKTLRDMGLKVERLRTRSNKAALDTVLLTDPPAGSAVAAGETVTLTLAEPTGRIDLQAEAPDAQWTSSVGPLTFRGLPEDGAGFVLVDPAAALEDGTTANVLETHPEWQPNGTITGRFTLAAPVIAGDHLRAEVGFRAGSDDEVEFVVSARGQELLRVKDSGADGRLRPFDADLTRAVGATTVEISVLAGRRGDLDAAVWKDLRIEGRIG